MDKIIGTCSNCGGPVVIPEVWMGMTPPIPTCKNCGAQIEKPYGRTIKTVPVRKVLQ